MQFNNGLTASGLLSLCLMGCRAAPIPESLVRSAVQTSLADVAIAPQTLNANLADPLQFQPETRSEPFLIQPQVTGAQLVTAKGIQLAQFTFTDDTIKLTNAIGQNVGQVVIYRDRWQLEASDQTGTIAILRRQAEGRYALETPTFQPLYRLQAHSSGLSLETPDQQVLYDVQTISNQKVLRNASGQSMLTSSGNVNALALACFGFDLLTRKQQAALAYAVHISAGLWADESAEN
ncbi:MAG: hypothetical protein F6J87_28265 [Spirulina sp. SIO3F2]|nr:hypothetical protein [Spirulina sp. SIO3F2]